MNKGANVSGNKFKHIHELNMQEQVNNVTQNKLMFY